MREEKIKILCVSDIHNREHILEKVVKNKHGAEICVVAGDSISLGTLEEVKNFTDKISKFNGDVVFIAGNHCCYSDDTDVFTKDGWKKGIELTYDDEIATYNEECDSFQFQKAKNIVKREYTGTMYRFYDKFTHDVYVTSGHDLYTINNSDKKRNIVKSEDFDIKKHKIVISANGLEKDNDNFSDDEILLMAMIMSDGGIRFNVNKPNRYTFYQSKVDIIEFFKNTCNSIGITITNDKARDRDIKEICGKTLKKKPLTSHEFTFYYDKFDKYILNRDRIPEVVYSFSKRQFHIFIQMYKKCDGSWKASQRETTFALNGNELILGDLQALLHFNGYKGYMNVFREKDYRVNVCEKSIAASSTVEETEVKDIKVWCCTVDNKLLFTRRNGKVSICGNCSMSMTNKKFLDVIKKHENLHYLEDSYVKIKDIIFYGSPYTIRFKNWWFMEKESDLNKHFPKEPCDIMICHQPPSHPNISTCDSAFGDLDIGSTDYTELIKNSNIKYYITGHVHECGGKYAKIGNTDVFNCAGKVRIIEV